MSAAPAAAPTSTHALLLVDLQRWIVGQRWSPRSGDDVAWACAVLLEQARAAGEQVVHVRYLRLDGSDGGPTGSPSAIVEALAPAAGEPVVDKFAIDAFDGTDLEARLSGAGVVSVTVAGLTTSHAVASTALTAARKGLAVRVSESATACFDASRHTTTLRALARAGVEITP